VSPKDRLPQDQAPGPDLHDRVRRWWDLDAETYDHSPTHGGSEPVEAAVWRGILLRHLPPPGSRVLDAGAGTGAMALLLVELGHDVTALDLSPEMLGRLREKAEARGLSIRTVVAPATEPPPGPFDAVVERHLLWTVPDPVAALRAWRRVVPEGRLVSYEGIFGGQDPLSRARGWMAEGVRRLRRVPPDHHGSYEPDLLATLPLAGRMGPRAMLEVAGEAGWSRLRIERLRDVEWARRLAAPPMLGRLEGVPHFALLAQA
jgi:SAM-dependent methyltransferase